MKRLLYFFPMLAALVLPAAAQQARWHPEGGTLGFNQTTSLELLFEDCRPLENFSIPAVDSLEFGTPTQGSRTSIIHGVTSQQYSFTFPVRPLRRETATIPSFEVITDKGRVRVPAVTFQVGDATIGNTNVPIETIASSRLVPGKQEVWAGEVFPISYTIMVARRYFHQYGSHLQFSAPPLVAEEWSKPEEVATTSGGEQRTGLVYQTRAYARNPGQYAIPAASQLVNLRTGSRSFDIFAPLAVEQYRVNSNEPVITVRPLPDPPQDFHGAVGSFAFSGKVVPDQVAVGEPITWSLELSGTGNWPANPALPSRAVPQDFEVIQPPPRRNSPDGTLFDGTLSEDIVLIPTQAGTYRLGPVSYTFFDPQTGTYQSLVTEEVIVQVQPAGGPGVRGARTSRGTAPAGPVAATSLPPASTARPMPLEPLAGTGWSLRPLAFLEGRHLLLPFAPVFLFWIGLAARRARNNDPALPRRQALARLRRELAVFDPKAAAKRRRSLRLWQRDSARLWGLGRAVPSAQELAEAIASLQASNAEGMASEWAQLWREADRALYASSAELPADWSERARRVLRGAQVPRTSLRSLVRRRNLLPFLLLFLMAVPAQPARADDPGGLYRDGAFDRAAAVLESRILEHPGDWRARHNLALALAQQGRWTEASAHWTAAFLLNPRDPSVQFHLKLGLERTGFADRALAALAEGSGLSGYLRALSPGEWQILRLAGILLVALLLCRILLVAYRGSRPGSAAVLLVLAGACAAAAGHYGLNGYGILAEPRAGMLWEATILHSIPTEAVEEQESQPLTPGTVAAAERDFLGWIRLRFSNGQTGWVRSRSVIFFYQPVKAPALPGSGGGVVAAAGS